jgi:hypothetical protein
MLLLQSMLLMVIDGSDTGVVGSDTPACSVFLLLLMTSSLSLSCCCRWSLTPTSSLPAALYFECWLDTELANTDKERSVAVAKGVLILLINFNFKASSK